MDLWRKISQSINQDWLLFMWSLDYYKIAYLQYGFLKESSKINTSHMAHIEMPIFQCF